LVEPKLQFYRHDGASEALHETSETKVDRFPVRLGAILKNLHGTHYQLMSRLDGTDNVGYRGEQTTEELLTVLPTRRVQSVFVTASRASAGRVHQSYVRLRYTDGLIAAVGAHSSSIAPSRAARSRGANFGAMCGLAALRVLQGHELRRGGPSQGCVPPMHFSKFDFFP
jgi:hypothetical protein